MAVEYLPVDSLTRYAKNSRTHSATQVDQLAASMREFGFTNPVLIDEAGGIIAGHGRVEAAARIGLQSVPCIRLSHLSDAQKRAYVIADNQIALNAGWDEQLLRVEMQDLQRIDFDLQLLGFDDDALAAIVADQPGTTTGNTDPDETPELPEVPATVEGDVWVLGHHRVMCGDSIKPEDVARLMDGQVAQLIHADPPYGMGKEADGVANDNLYAAKLDAFQMAWWRAFRRHAADNASAYIWGNAPDLWRLWYAGGLAASERLEMRNEICWDKKSIAGMASADMLCYPMATERCLYFQIGNQFVSNINAADFPEQWDPLRAYLHGQAEAFGIGAKDVQRVCGCGMYSHWFTRSQFTLIPERHYASLQSAYPGAFARSWADLKSEWDRVRGTGRAVINGQLLGMRSYFDNAHAVMRDVWEFPRVTGEERYDHATPKPVAMMERVMRSSLPPGGLCAEPFGGTGSTLIGAEATGRKCFVMELKPVYCDVIIRRWQAYTGRQAVHAVTGQPFPTSAQMLEAA